MSNSQLSIPIFDMNTNLIQLVLITIFVVVYFLSSSKVERWLIKAYSKHGIYSDSFEDKHLTEILVSCPVLNMVVALYCTIKNPYK